MQRFTVLFSVLLAVVWSGAASANSAPVVSNVTVSQRTDGSKKVDIRYNLSDADGDRCTISVQVSSDDGATWTVPAVTFSGAVGAGVAPGTGKLIVWDCTADLAGVYGTNYKVKVTADDGYEPPIGPDMVPTTQIWYFGTDQVMPVPDAVDNTYGVPQLKVDKGSGAGWQSAAGRRTGIWSLSGEIDVVIPNYQVPNPYKEITISLTWAPGGADPFLPDQPLVGVSAIPMYKMTMDVVNDPMAGTIWTQSIYSIVIWPNPPREWIAIKGDILVDELGIKTKCVPEAEWEYASRGGLAGRRFPWGDTITHSLANYYSSSSYSYDISRTRGFHPAWDDRSPYTSPVGSFPVTGYGLYDMAGNVWEWCNDRYQWNYYTGRPNPDVNPSGPVSGSDRVLRGGGWGLGIEAFSCRVSSRGGDWPVGAGVFGFRLVLPD